MVTIGLLHSTIRGDEKLIIEAAKKRKVKIQLIDIRNEVLNRETYRSNFDIALERSVSAVKGMHASRFFESLHIPVVNSSRVAEICEDKFYTSLVLQKAHVPTPSFALVFTFQDAIKAVRELGGFPVVIKPPLGSWGRLLAKINDIDSLEAVLEHKDVLGSPHQKAFYIQKYIKKPGRDIRAYVLDGKTIGAVYRNSEHWITNTARGGTTTKCPVTNELKNLCKKASNAIGKGILSMDIFETEEGLQVNEVNHTTEFKNSEKPSGVSIAGAMVDYCVKLVKNL